MIAPHVGIRFLYRVNVSYISLVLEAKGVRRTHSEKSFSAKPSRLRCGKDAGQISRYWSS